MERCAQATRAVHDALPILRKADKVVVYSIDPPFLLDHIPGSYLCAHLKDHGVAAEPESSEARDVDVGDALLNVAATRGSDLLVMGAYGHSRLSEMVFGGATRHLLQHMTLPVLS